MKTPTPSQARVMFAAAALAAASSRSVATLDAIAALACLTKTQARAVCSSLLFAGVLLPVGADAYRPAI